MSDSRGPWHREEPPPPPPSPRGRGWLWIAVLAGVGVLLWFLSTAFPGSLHSGDDWLRLAQGLAVLTVVAAGILSARRTNWGQKARHAGIWVGVLGVLFVVAAYRDELAGVGQHLRSEFSGAYPVAAGEREVVITRNEQDGFFVMGAVNGQPVRFFWSTPAPATRC